MIRSCGGSAWRMGGQLCGGIGPVGDPLQRHVHDSIRPSLQTASRDLTNHDPPLMGNWRRFRFRECQPHLYHDYHLLLTPFPRMSSPSLMGAKPTLFLLGLVPSPIDGLHKSPTRSISWPLAQLVSALSHRHVASREGVPAPCWTLTEWGVALD